MPHLAAVQVFHFILCWPLILTKCSFNSFAPCKHYFALCQHYFVLCRQFPVSAACVLSALSCQKFVVSDFCASFLQYLSCTFAFGLHTFGIGRNNWKYNCVAFSYKHDWHIFQSSFNEVFRQFLYLNKQSIFQIPKLNYIFSLSLLLAALAALYLTLVSEWVSNRHFRILTQRVTFETCVSSDIWSECCQDKKTKK